MNIFNTMHTLRLSLAATVLCIAGCAGMDNPFDTSNREMTPLEGAGEKPNIRNRFPESRGGLPLSPVDREHRDMTPFERLKQY